MSTNGLPRAPLTRSRSASSGSASMTSSATWATADVAERAEDDPLGAAAVQMLDRAEELRRALPGAEGEDPGDRQVGEADGQRAQRRRGPTVGPLQVVERDQQRPAEGRALEHRLQVLQQPVPLLGQRVKLLQPGSLEQRVRAVEERRHQRSELDDPGAGLGRAGADPEREPSRDPRRLRQQTRLAHARLSLDEHHRADAQAHAVELNTDRREFNVPTANNGSRRRSPGPDRRVYGARHHTIMRSLPPGSQTTSRRDIA